MLTLALASGPTTAIFSFLNAAFLRPLPVASPEQLVRVYTGVEGEGPRAAGRFSPMSYPDFVDFRDQTTSVFTGLAAASPFQAELGAEVGQRPVRAALVSGDYFSLLGVRVVAGRAIQPDEERVAGSPTVAVVSHALWKSRFGGELRTVGQTLLISASPYTVVGIAAKGFHGIDFGYPVDVWVPLSMRTPIEPAKSYVQNRDARNLTVVGRIRPGVSRAQLQGTVQRVARGLAALYPETNAQLTATLVPVEGGGSGGVPLLVKALSGVVAFVLLIACANIANLFLVRAAGRQRDAAIRLALGASRARLVRQLLLEALLLSTAGAVLGLLLATWGVAALRAGGVGEALDLQPDLRVLGFSLLVGIAAGIAFGLAGAFRSSRANVAESLKDQAPAAGRRRGGAQGALVIIQLALSLVLVLGTSMLVQSINALRQVDPGFAADQLLMVRVDFSERQQSDSARYAFYTNLLERVRAIPEVRSASAGGMPLLLGWRPLIWPVRVPGYSYGPRESRIVQFDVVGPDYFRTIGLNVVSGRDFTVQDIRGWPPRHVVVNEALAKRFWPGQSPIGRALLVKEKHAAEVIGMVRDARLEDVREAPAPRCYWSFLNSTNREFYLYARTSGHPRAVAPAVLRAISELDANAGARAEITTVAESREKSFEFNKGSALVFGGFSILAVLLAGVGLYGLMAYMVTLRTREIGIRMALGARSTHVVGNVLWEATRLAALGVLAGGAIAMGVISLTRSLFYGVAPQDPWAVLSVVVVLVALVLVASFVPARRAARVDPMHALRAE